MPFPFLGNHGQAGAGRTVGARGHGLSAGSVPSLDSLEQSFGSRHVKSEKAGFGHGLGDGEEGEGNFQVLPRFQSRSNGWPNFRQRARVPVLFSRQLMAS